MSDDDHAWPTELRLSADRRILHVAFEDGLAADLPAEMLRVMSPSAEVQGHSPEERKTIPGKRDVEIIGIEPVGNYAIRIRFDDLHDSGIFNWPLLHHFGRERDSLLAAYFEELAEKGLSREPMRRS